MALVQRDKALSLLAAANNHGDLAVKLSSLKQAKDILLSADSSLAAELFPYLVELQSSPESLVRKALVEAIEEIGLEAMESSSILMPVLLTLLNDNDSVVARHSVVAGANIFWSVLKELTSQFHRRGMVERWLEELWTLMVKFKDTVFRIPVVGSCVGPKLLAIKFMESLVLLLSPDNSERKNSEAIRTPWTFNPSWLVAGHPILDPDGLMSEANRAFDVLLNFLRSAGSLPGVVLISVVNSLAAISRKRPAHYNSVLSALLDFHLNFDTAKGVHTASVQYSLRTAFLGFLRCTYPPILESRDRLLRALRAMNAGDAADQVIRQADKMLRNSERASRDARLSKEEQTPSQVFLSADQTKKRSTPMDLEEPMDTYDSKRIRYGPITHASLPIQMSDSGQDNSVIGVSPKVPSLGGDLTPVEQMIAMIGALIAEGERGAESLDILISKIHPDLLADIVITNMKHLPKNPPPLVSLGNLPVTRQSDLSSGPSQMLAPITSTVSAYTSTPAAQVPLPSNVLLSTLSDTATTSPADTKRDPRRDPRRLDPRRIAVPVGASSEHIVEDNTSVILSDPVESEVESSIPPKKPLSLPVVTSAENTSVPFVPKTETNLHISESVVSSRADRFASKEDVLDRKAKEAAPDPEPDVGLDLALSPVHEVVQDLVELKSPDVVMTDEAYSLYLPETDQLSPPAVDTPVSEEACVDLPVLPLYVELTEEQQRSIRKLAIERIIDSYKLLRATDNMQTRMALLARLVAQTDADDDVVVMIQKHIVSDYQHQKGHELVMHVLYHLHSLMITDSDDSSIVRVLYERILLGVAKSLLDALPATDKSFSRLFGEAPFLPDSALKLLDDICCSDNSDEDVRDGDRVTQGLGSLWSLILGRPHNRQACLDIAFKCAVHTRDDIRAKAIRLVANKLYVISYISENIEDFASNMLLSAVDRHASDVEQRTEGEMGSQETSISGSQTEAGTSENDSAKGAHSDSPMSFPQAQCQISLFFALCTKKPSLLQLVFHHYGRAPKAVKQAIHRHIPVLMRALGSSYSELLRIISDPPQGSENLLTQVLHILSEGTAPSADLVATVKRLYETKLKDATILIPMLSSFTKNEVLPIFPRLVDLPLDKFQTALAHILQGSAHTGPALTPAEVLVAIHDINPEKDGVALKKIMDACSACFEQRTVFTHQVLAKALNQMVDQTPIPLLFMRTVIQAIDAFPTLVDFVMEILSKLVSKQVWRLPKLWVGFLKCISQTQPHSFHVLLQLPSPQLEGALNKYPKLRSALSAYANQPSVKASLPRSTLLVLGLVNESHVQQAHLVTSFHSSDKNSSLHGATLT